MQIRLMFRDSECNPLSDEPIVFDTTTENGAIFLTHIPIPIGAKSVDIEEIKATQSNATPQETMP